MADRGGYGQFCPVSMAAEIVCTRWTPMVLRELLCGVTRFSDLRKGVPRMSPTLLSKRLKELEAAGVVETRPRPDGNVDYVLTEMGEELRPVVMGLGSWGHRWIESTVSLRNLDPTLLMWDMHRCIDPRRLPADLRTIQFLYPDVTAYSREYWFVVEGGKISLCITDPGHDVDLLVTSPLRALTAIWMGLASLQKEMAAGQVTMDGNPAHVRALGACFTDSSAFVAVERRVA